MMVGNTKWEANVSALAKMRDWRTSAKLATTANITLSGEQVIDGVSAVTGDTVLVKDQTLKKDNGVYVVSTLGWTRLASASDSTSLTPGVSFYIEYGVINVGSIWTIDTNSSIVVGTTDLIFRKVSDRSNSMPMVGSNVLYNYSTNHNSAGSFAVSRFLKDGTFDKDLLTMDGTGNISTTGNISVTGNVTATGNVAGYSDIRLKQDLKAIENALESVRSLTGYTYVMKMTGRPSTGLVAQDVVKVLPEAVETDEDGFMALSYGNMMGLIVEAIKELSTRVEALERKA